MRKKRSISLNSIIYFLFLIGVFCLPLNSDPPAIMNLLGEFRRESVALFFFIALVFLIGRDIIRQKINFPYRTAPYSIFLIFIGYVLIGYIINIPDIKDYFFKGTTGIVRFIKQFISLALVGLVIFYVLYNAVLIKGAEKGFESIRRFMLYSLILMSFYGFIEIAIMYLGMTFLIPVTKLFDYIPFVETSLDFFGGRLVGLTYEPPALGTYLVTIAGFMFSYILTGKGIVRFVPFFLVLFFAILSKSRAAFVIILVQVLVGVIYAYFTVSSFRYWSNRVMLVGSILLIGILSYKSQEIAVVVEERIEDLNFWDKSQDNKLSISNKSRLGIQYANLQVFVDNPIFGVGWGQQTFEGMQHVPSWSKHNNWEFTYKYLNPRHAPFPSGYNLYIRLLAETGIVGLVIFLSFLGYFLIGLIKYLYRADINQKYIFLGLLITSIGAMINWFQTDTLRLYGFWLSLAIFMVYLKENKIEYENKG